MRPDGSGMTLPAFAVLGAAFCYACQAITARHLSGTETTLALSFWVLVGPFVFAATLTNESNWVTPDTTGWLLVVAAGFFSVIAWIGLVNGYRSVSPATLAPLSHGRRVVMWNPPNRLPPGDGLLPIMERALRDAERTGCEGRIVLGGASFGGMLALLAALHVPDRVAGIVLLGSAASWSEVARGVRFGARLHDLVPSRLYKRWLPRALVPTRFDGPRGSPVGWAIQADRVDQRTFLGNWRSGRPWAA